MQHRLALLKIKNFKSIIDCSLELESYTPLVGYNNAGKTNIINAIIWLLRKSSLPVESFYDSQQPIEVEGTIKGITSVILNTLSSNHRAAITNFVNNETITIKRVQVRPGDTAANIKMYIKNPQAQNIADEWVVNPTGIDQAINLLFPEPIYIGAMENAEEDVAKSKAGTTIGKLLGEIIEPIETQYGTQVIDALSGLKNLLDAEGANRAQELTSFDTVVNQKIDTFFPDVNIKLHVPTPELKDVFSKGTIKVYESTTSNGRDVSSLGHGAQRSIQMALIQHLAEMRRTNHANSTTLLLIDEPELYLHPQAVEVVRDALKELSRNGYQVVFSTHSAIMVNHDDVGNSILVRKNQTQGTHRRQTLKSVIPQVVADAQSQLHLLFSLSNSSNILFSERVILTEGETELRILPIVFEKVTLKTLGYFKFALVRQGGVANTKKSMSVLKMMDLPNKAIVDLDYVFKNAISDGFIDATDSDIESCRTIINSLSSTHGFIVDSQGWPIKKGSNITPSEAFAILATQASAIPLIESLHQKLRAKNIWLWKLGSIEKHLGITGKSESVWADLVGKLNNQPIDQVIRDITGIRECIGWLTT